MQAKLAGGDRLVILHSLSLKASQELTATSDYWMRDEGKQILSLYFAFLILSAADTLLLSH